VSARAFTLTAAHGHRHRDVPTASYGTVFNLQDPHEETRDTRTMINLQHDRAIGRTRLAAEIGYDRLRYSGVYPYPGETGDAPPIVQDDHALGARWSASVRVARPLPGRQMVTAGAEFLASVTQRQWYAYRDDAGDSASLDTPSRQAAFYLQDEIRLTPWLIASGGLRHDVYRRFSRTTPRGAVIVMPTANQSFKYLYGRAFRAPNAYELYYYVDASGALRPETIDTHEAVWEQYLGEWLRTSVSAYRYAAAGLIALQSDGDEDFGFVNIGAVRARGLEFETEVRTKQGLQVLGGYGWQRARDGAQQVLPNSPARTGTLRVSVPVATSTAAFDVQWLSGRRTVAGTMLDGAAVAQATMTSRLTPSLELVASVRNLFNARYADPASEEHTFDAIEQNGRTASVGLRWTLGARRR
jgi:outer membrane receptor for ferrienterochelin and colicins